jgi:hypothetical protein
VPRPFDGLPIEVAVERLFEHALMDLDGRDACGLRAPALGLEVVRESRLVRVVPDGREPIEEIAGRPVADADADIERLEKLDRGGAIERAFERLGVGELFGREPWHGAGFYPLEFGDVPVFHRPASKGKPACGKQVRPRILRVMTRRDWLKTTAGMGGALLLPNVTGLLESASAAQATATKTPMAAGRERLLADFGWRFHLGHANDPGTRLWLWTRQRLRQVGSFISGGGRGNPAVTSNQFTAADWTAVDLPHDWAIDLPFISDRGQNGHGAKPLGRAYPETSVGWYRRTFTIPSTDLGRRITLEFDGVFRDAIVVLNGHYIGRNLSGYAPFRFDVTDLINYGTAEAPGNNTLVVRADATESEGWFYEGAGIYRHVWLDKTAPLHVAHWGTFVRTEITGAPPQTAQPLPAGTAIVHVDVDVQNESDSPALCNVGVTILDARGRDVGAGATVDVTIPAGGRHTFKPQATVRSPALWSIESPNMYKGRGNRSDECRTNDCRHLRHAVWNPDRRVRRRQGLLPQRQVREDQRHVQSPGPRGCRVRIARSPAVLPHREAEGDGRQRLPDVAQSADAGAAGRLRSSRHAGARRDAHDVVERRRSQPARTARAARPESSVRLLLVDRQRGTGAGHLRSARARPRR